MVDLTEDVRIVIRQARVPNFVLINGEVHYFIGNSKGILRREAPLEYRRHGSFNLIFVHGSNALIRHYSPRYPENQKLHDIKVPLFRRVTISSGEHELFKLDDPTYLAYRKVLLKNADYPEDLEEKYIDLLSVFQDYWEKNFHPSVQEEAYIPTFVLGARIRYGMVCVMEGRAIPNDCQHELLSKEIYGWISYYEDQGRKS